MNLKVETKKKLYQKHLITVLRPNKIQQKLKEIKHIMKNMNINKGTKIMQNITN